jgi:hypothetical protein
MGSEQNIITLAKFKMKILNRAGARTDP